MNLQLRLPLTSKDSSLNERRLRRLLRPSNERQRLNENALNVLLYLKKNTGRWVANKDLADPAVGGLEAMRRLRELRAAGHNIEKRHLMAGIWEYRYLPEAE